MGVHEPVETPAKVKVEISGTAEARKRTTTTTYSYTCCHCGTSAIAGELLAPVAGILSLGGRVRLLASYWCKEGHLMEEISVSSYYSFSRYYSYSRAVRRCVMCGAGYPSRPVTDEGLWAPLQLEPEALSVMLSGRDRSTRSVTEPVVHSVRAQERLERAEKRTTKARARAREKYDLYNVPWP